MPSNLELRRRECLISEDETKAILSPHHSVFEAVVREAFGVWERIAPTFQKPLKRTRAQVISNAYYDRALASFGERSGIKVVEESERLLLAVNDRLVMRFKRLDREERTHNYPTRASRAMDAQKQTDIPDIGRLPRIVLGYMIDEGVVPKLAEIRIVFAVSNRVMWSYAVDGSYAGTMPLPFKQTPPTEEPYQFRMIGEEDEADEAADGDE